MTALELLARLRESGIHVTTQGDRLRVSAARGALTDKLRTELYRHKPELMELLRLRKAAIRPPIVLADRSAEFPLSFQQQRLWFLDQLEPGSTAYNVPFVWRLRGVLHTEALRRALEAIVRRHEPLRTTFAMVDEEPVQAVGTIERLGLPVEDLRSFESEQQGNGDRHTLSVGGGATV